MNELALELQKMDYTIDMKYRSQGILVIRDFHIHAGRNAGKVVEVGIPVARYPDIPPTAVHIRPILDTPAQGAVQARCPLGPDWVYWSRRIQDWSKDRSPRRIVIWLNSVVYFE